MSLSCYHLKDFFFFFFFAIKMMVGLETISSSLATVWPIQFEENRLDV